jgi:hypothetical protein
LFEGVGQPPLHEEEAIAAWIAPWLQRIGVGV